MLLLAPRPVTLVDKIILNNFYNLGVSVAWILNVKPSCTIDSQNGCHFGK